MLDIFGGLETFENEGIFLAADDVFDDFRLGGVVLVAAGDGEEDLDEVQDIFVDFVAGGAAEVEEVEQLHFEGNALAADHDVVVVDVAVVFAAGVDGGDAFGKDVEDVEGFEGGEAVAGLGFEEFAELLAFDELGDDDGDSAALEPGDFLVVVLHEDGAVAQGVEFAGVVDGRATDGVAMGVVEFGGAGDAGCAFGDDVDFAFPAGAEGAFDAVFPGDGSAGGEVEALEFLEFSGAVRHLELILGAHFAGVKFVRERADKTGCLTVQLWQGIMDKPIFLAEPVRVSRDKRF